MRNNDIDVHIAVSFYNRLALLRARWAKWLSRSKINYQNHVSQAGKAGQYGLFLGIALGFVAGAIVVFAVTGAIVAAPWALGVLAGCTILGAMAGSLVGLLVGKKMAKRGSLLKQEAAETEDTPSASDNLEASTQKNLMSQLGNKQEFGKQENALITATQSSPDFCDNDAIVAQEEQRNFARFGYIGFFSERNVYTSDSESDPICTYSEDENYEPTTEDDEEKDYDSRLILRPNSHTFSE